MRPRSRGCRPTLGSSSTNSVLTSDVPSAVVEIDALHLAARQRARLPIEREVAQAHVAQIPQAVPDLAEHQLGRVVERLRQLDALEECERALDGQHHEVVDREARQRGERSSPVGRALGHRCAPEAPLGVDDGGRIGERAEPP